MKKLASSVFNDWLLHSGTEGLEGSLKVTFVLCGTEHMSSSKVTLKKKKGGGFVFCFCIGKDGLFLRSKKSGTSETKLNE